MLFSIETIGVPVAIALACCAFFTPSLLAQKAVRATAAYFSEQSGLLVVEAENTAGKTPSTYARYANVHTWKLISPSEGASGAACLEAVPDERGEDGLGPSSPRDASGAGLSYRIQISTPGEYHVFIRGWSRGGESNGVHVGLNGKLAGKEQGASNISGFRPHRRWVWEHSRKEGYEGTARLSLAAGLHVLNVWNRDDGFCLDRIVLSLDSRMPEDLGPPESPVTDGVHE